MHYHIYFRISRGGIGIPYELAKTEFQAVFNDFGMVITSESWARRHMHVDLDLEPVDVKTRAADLGYTEAILHLHSEPYRDEALSPIERGRWHVGWVRRRERKVYQTEVYVQDSGALLKYAPDKRGFQIEQGGEKRLAFGHHAHRAMSVLDVRFLFNIVMPSPVDVVLDPFAGYGGIVFEGRRRGLSVMASDIDHTLTPGLSALTPGSCYVADARLLPLAENSIDLIVTEPPFRTVHRPAVLKSIRELRRVLKPSGQMVFVVSSDMREEICASFAKLNLKIDIVGVIPRGGGLKCPVLKIRPID
ncbi:MAG: methyltransferase domain-containing protein [Candidatus Poribacteria bacterium]|nr:methyltransferase domain-containing protein [Candidatus Poribacteria bacterium]MDE0504382.1 methyltransferase domain-containing protein [Candidatus Poribacteria bacterium]